MSSNGSNNGLLIFITTLILVGVAFIAWKVWFEKPQSQPEPTGCTLEAKICPDGSAVYRTGPNCEFTACPSGEQNPAPSPAY